VSFGVADEFHQSFVPRRHPSAGDVAADGAGSAAGLALAVAVARARARLEAPLAVSLITGPGCSLCTEARDMLQRLAARQPLRIEEISISGSQDLTVRYGQRVPVVLVRGQVVAAGRLDEARLAASLTARRPTGEQA
jgi:hypothetical protein